MKTFFRFLAPALSAAFMLLSCSGKSPFRNDAELSAALDEIDMLLQKEEEITAEKMSRIDSLRFVLREAQSGPELYGVYDRLFDEYLKWDCDSAMLYAHWKLDLAYKSSSEDLIADASADLARRYIISAMYYDALYVVKDADSHLSAARKNEPSRQYLLYEIYHGLVLAFGDKYVESMFKALELRYLDAYTEAIDMGSIDYFIFTSKTMIANGRNKELIAFLQQELSERQFSVQDRAVIHYWIGKAYENIGDERNALLWYAQSAKCDLEGSIREYRSLIRVAQLCFKYGMTDFAYRCITRCYSDAVISDSRIRIIQIGDTLSQVVSAYERQSVRHHKIITFLNTGLRVLLSMLALAVVFLMRNQAKLNQANADIHDSLSALRESDRIKDVYIGQFMSVFSNHIDALERYRSGLRVTAKQMDFTALLQELRSDDFINGELSNLYGHFDKTFLRLFPNFVVQLNSLLKYEARVGKNIPEGSLSNELRVAALIRLGVTDSKRIAKFLRLSPTTVFNYRVKFRNGSIVGRETFEEKLSQIGL